MTTFNLPQIYGGVGTDELADVMARGFKELNWLMNGNLDSMNVGRINTNQTRIASNAGETLINGPLLQMTDGVLPRLNMGLNPDTGSFQFDLFNAAGASILSLGEYGLVFDWDASNTPTAAQVGARPASWMPTAWEVGARAYDWLPSPAEIDAVQDSMTAVFNTLTNYGQTCGLLLGPDDRVYLNVDYANTGFLTAARINTAGLFAERIYRPGYSYHYGVIGGSYVDLILNHSGTEWFRVRDEWDSGTGTYMGSLRLSSDPFLYFTRTSPGNVLSRPQGIWDFTNCSQVNFTGVSTPGLTATAVFD